ncbi:MAG TPA: FkbM family methyltransferase, partial [Verrucomicrobiae bacterium]
MSSLNKPLTQDNSLPLNILISGTNFWNPGDDFVRDGVAHVLRELFPGRLLNLFFYNFNADFFPQSKFSGIANCVSAGDLEKCRDSVDAIVIAGLSAGEEIKDLYKWILENGLEDRVYLIGAGYENQYVEQHITTEPEATIFQNARVIIGRTAKAPEFMRSLPASYVHLNCPALLSVPAVKEVPAGKKIERIGFSIQLPHGKGIINQSCDQEPFELACACLEELARQYQVELIAHHKSEYFYFLNRLRGSNIPVIFSSFYQDLFEIYPRYDLVITTRLHASLFANGHGIPGIIINDTDRHTHTLQGFPHSVWVNTKAGFDAAFTKFSRADLNVIAAEARAFKSGLTAKYLEVLQPVFEPSKAIHYQFDSEQKEQALVRSLVRPGMTVIDAGANIGKYTKLFSLLAGPAGKVFAFEPSPNSHARLAELVKADKLENVTLLNSALTHQPGTVMLHQFPEEYCSWNSLGRPQMPDPKDGSRLVPIINSAQVPATSLDEFCRERHITEIDYLKLDVEGAEILALQGARDLLAAKAIKHLQFEISKNMLDGLNTTARRIFDFLSEWGYSCHAITPEGRIGELVGDSSAFYENYIALPEPSSGHTEMFMTGSIAAMAQVNSSPNPFNDSPAESPATNYESIRAQVEAVPGFLCPGQEEYLFNKVRSLPENAIIVEIGSFKGRSTVAMGLACVGTRRRIFCIDTWDREDWEGTSKHFPAEGTFAVWQKNVRDNNLSDYVTPLQGRSHNILSRWDELSGGKEIDFIFIDGSHELAEVHRDFDLAYPLVKPGGWLALHDVVAEWPGPLQVWKDTASVQLENHEICSTIACGQKPSVRLQKQLPIHFFTIVLNGKPFIEHHIYALQQLTIPWHWHIIEGVAELNHDTGWSRATGGKIPSELHRDGLSLDGTTEYLNELARLYPQQITIYRKPFGCFWDGKIEMVNAPLRNIHQECLLWQIDADELWTAEQIQFAHRLFLARPDKTAAYYYCHYFVGKDRVITTRDTYGNNSSYEWLRTWRFTPGCRWTSHEPPRLCQAEPDGQFIDVASINPFLHKETDALDLVFQHYAYATEAQLQFKEQYYGYPNAVAEWKKLQAAKLPARLSDHLTWVKDGAMVNTIASQGIIPLIPEKFFTPDVASAAQSRHQLAHSVKKILFVRPDAIGDAVLAASMLEPLRLKYTGAQIAILCQEHLAQFWAASPCVDVIIGINKQQALADKAYREAIKIELQKWSPDLVLNSV